MSLLSDTPSIYDEGHVYVYEYVSKCRHDNPGRRIWTGPVAWTDLLFEDSEFAECECADSLP